jgi:hypothetical protein
MCTYIYIYREREREREWATNNNNNSVALVRERIMPTNDRRLSAESVPTSAESVSCGQRGGYPPVVLSAF